MRFLIIGAGAVGGTIGGRLRESGHEVVLVARGAHLAALRSAGLRLLTPDGPLELPGPAVGGPEEIELRPDDVLILAVKIQDAAAALDAWADRPVAGGGTAAERLPVVCAQNGVDGERQALRRFRRVYGMCVWLPSTYLEAGVIAAPCAPLTGMLHLGRYPAAPGRTGPEHAELPDPVMRGIAEALNVSRFAAPLPGDVLPWKYAKLLMNLGNALEAVAGQAERDDDGFRDLLARARDEGRQVLAAAGIAPIPEEEQQRVRSDRMTIRPVAGAERGGGSSWQSLMRGTGTIEADYLNGEIALLGRLHGVPTPVNETLQRAANALAREGRSPGALSVAALTKLCDAAAATEAAATDLP